MVARVARADVKELHRGKARRAKPALADSANDSKIKNMLPTSPAKIRAIEDGQARLLKGRSMFILGRTPCVAADSRYVWNRLRKRKPIRTTLEGQHYQMKMLEPL